MLTDVNMVMYNKNLFVLKVSLNMAKHSRNM